MAVAKELIVIFPMPGRVRTKQPSMLPHEGTSDPPGAPCCDPPGTLI